MDTNCTQQYIADLIDRFMAGATSLEEEQVLHDYLLAADDLPQEWEAYRQMFEYFDAGMETPRPRPRRRERRWWMAAASLLLLVGMVAMWSLGRGSESSEANSYGVGEGLVSQLQPSDSAARSQTVATSSLSGDVICPPASQTSMASITQATPSGKTKGKFTRRSLPGEDSSSADGRLTAAQTGGSHGEEVPDSDAAEVVRSFSEMREQQALAIRNEVVEAVFEMLPDAHGQLHLATDESGAYTIVPKTLVREL